MKIFTKKEVNFYYWIKTKSSAHMSLSLKMLKHFFGGYTICVRMILFKIFIWFFQFLWSNLFQYLFPFNLFCAFLFFFCVFLFNSHVFYILNWNTFHLTFECDRISSTRISTNNNNSNNIIKLNSCVIDFSKWFYCL